jgi:hypothetical protein
MDEIYSKAIQVNVHLGEGDEKTDEACKAVKRLAAACMAVLEAERTGVGKETTRRDYDEVADEVLGKFSTPDLLQGIVNCMRMTFENTMAVSCVSLQSSC